MLNVFIDRRVTMTKECFINSRAKWKLQMLPKNKAFCSSYDCFQKKIWYTLELFIFVECIRSRKFKYKLSYLNNWMINFHYQFRSYYKSNFHFFLYILDGKYQRSGRLFQRWYNVVSWLWNNSVSTLKRTLGH